MGHISTPRHTISCGPYTIEITANCFSALFHLREQLGSFVIWIDAICINQTDAREKANQIPLMQEIYSAADPTYIWLGEGTSETDAVMDYLTTAGFQKDLVPDNETKYMIPASQYLRWKAALKEYFGCYIAFLCCQCIFTFQFLVILVLIR